MQAFVSPKKNHPIVDWPYRSPSANDVVHISKPQAILVRRPHRHVVLVLEGVLHRIRLHLHGRERFDVSTTINSCGRWVLPQQKYLVVCQYWFNVEPKVYCVLGVLRLKQTAPLVKKHRTKAHFLYLFISFKGSESGYNGFSQGRHPLYSSFTATIEANTVYLRNRTLHISK